MYLFNPDNDLALANFKPSYTSPASARKLKSDLALLPIWYAPNGVAVIAEGKLNVRFLKTLKGKLPISNSLIFFSKLEVYPHSNVRPWGWNPALRRELMMLGMNEDSLPSLSDIEVIRNYSGRQNAVRLLTELKQENSELCGESFFYTDIDALLDYVNISIGDQVLKMPYSGSGKGIMWIKGDITDKQIDWCKRVIKTQGGVVIEPVLNKVQDFAMEFEITDSGVQFVGYSLFQSAPSGAYVANMLMSDVAIEEQLTTQIELRVLKELRTTLKAKLNAFFPHYRGYLGVDMMICKTTDNVYQLQPCVEINLRMNMGIVAHRFYERFVHPNSSGMYAISFFKQDGQAQAYEHTMQNSNPLIIEDEKIKSGYFALTPVNEETRYVAYVTIKQNY